MLYVNTLNIVRIYGDNDGDTTRSRQDTNLCTPIPVIIGQQIMRHTGNNTCAQTLFIM